MDKVRYCNPGNIMQRNGAKFKGEIKSPHKRLAAFKDIEYGIRAMRILLLNYMWRKKCDTYRKIINRYAPSFENDTEAYLKFVCEQCGAKPDDKVLDLFKLIRAICKIESGYDLKWATWVKAMKKI